MEWLLVNIPFLVVLLLLVINVISGVKKGAVQKVCSLISNVVASVVVLLIAFAIRQYFNNEKIIFILTIILLLLLIIVYKILELALTTLKFIAKIPVVGFFNKLLGILIGVVEVVFTVCIVYTLVKVMDLGIIERAMMDCRDANPIMSLIYNLNEATIYPIVAPIGEAIWKLDFFRDYGI